MHIQEGTNTTLTTCTKMTEEVDRRHGVNGNSSSKVIDETPGQNSANSATGGRLKFFKDGKFILELVRDGSREGRGGGGGWVSVPRKTFWPPPGNAPVAHTAHLPRAERAASLSVSDDNSSIQSSPWQRDHCWKQTTPRRNISKELTMFYCRPSTLLTRTIEAASRRKRRRPLDAVEPARNGTNGLAHHGASPEREPDRDATDLDRDKYHMKLKKPHHYHKVRVYKKTRPPLRRKELTRVVTALSARAPPPAPALASAPVNAKLASCRQHEHAMVSPRKRILRELERVSLEDGCKRRARARAEPGPSRASPAAATPPPPPAPAPAPAPRHVGSYSIQSLLSLPERVDRAERSPPARASPGMGSPYLPRWAREELPYVYGYGPPLSYLPPLYRAPPSAPPPAPPPPAPSRLYYYSLPPGPWAPLAHPLLTDHIPKDEPSADLPLNLSKH